MPKKQKNVVGRVLLSLNVPQKELQRYFSIPNTNVFTHLYCGGSADNLREKKTIPQAVDRMMEVCETTLLTNIEEFVKFRSEATGKPMTEKEKALLAIIAEMKPDLKVVDLGKQE